MLRPCAFVAGLLLLVVAAPRLSGQGGGGDAGGTSKPPAIDSEKLLDAQTLNVEDPLPFMLVHTTQLKLTENQATRIAAIQGEAMRKNQDLQDRLDSIRPPGTSTRINFSLLTPTERDSVFGARKAIAATTGQMHDNSRRARTEALALLTPEQQQAFTELEQDMRNVLRDANWGSRNGDGGTPQTSGAGPP